MARPPPLVLVRTALRSSRRPLPPLSLSLSRRPHSTAPVPAPTPTPTPRPTHLPGSNLPPPSTKYSPLTVALVNALARLFGYHSSTSTAIRTASDYYDRCAERHEVESAFFYTECGLPPSFQTWFSLTTLHLHLLTVRLRALPPPLGRAYTQELLNHFFIDIELRIRGPYAVSQSRLVKGYMVDMLSQYRGSATAYDEAFARPRGSGTDAVLAAALWRNLFGAGWGVGAGQVGGVTGKKAPKPGEAPTLGPDPRIDHVQAKVLLGGGKKRPEDVFAHDEPVVDPAHAHLAGPGPPVGGAFPDAEFVQKLERLVRWVRREAQRLESIPDDQVLVAGPGGRGPLVAFSRI